MFETDRLPDGWVDRLNQMDEIWVPTQFHRELFERTNNIHTNVRVVGQGIDSNRWDPEKAKPLQQWGGDWMDPHQHCHPDDFKFLSVFKWEARKGHDILIPAFWEAFYGSDDNDATTTANANGVCLVIVTSLYHTDPEHVLGDVERYWVQSSSRNEHRAYEDTKGVLLLSGLSEEELISVYKSVDAFVLPSRGEGWGRPYMEAMSMGLPVVATNWSGPTAFVTNENGYLLPITGLVDAELEAFPGHKWANPDKKALKRLLLHIRNDPEEGRRKGQRARQDVLELWSHERVALDIAQELERIRRNINVARKAEAEEDEL